uniref:Uncharacterized protein n=1 Tax=Arundo donax TaxID=35708 RepID=A0A0A9E3M0_ARUDO
MTATTGQTTSVHPAHRIGRLRGAEEEAAARVPGGRSRRAVSTSEMAWMVFPIPISSARMPPRVAEASWASAHASHSFWNRSSGSTTSGPAPLSARSPPSPRGPPRARRPRPPPCARRATCR